MTPDEYLGQVLSLCVERRGEQIDLTYAGSRAMVVYRLPLNEVVFDFYDRLKSVTRGYASFDYQMDSYISGDLVKVSILVNGDPVDALAMIVHREQSEYRGRAICARLKERPDPAPNVQNCFTGGNWQQGYHARQSLPCAKTDSQMLRRGCKSNASFLKAEEGKKRMRQFGRVDIPQNAFLEALKMGDNWGATDRTLSSSIWTV